MRTTFSLAIAFVISLFTISVNAQVQCIADAEFKGAPYASLYKMLGDGKPVVLALGDAHAQSSERLLASGALQNLAKQHGASRFGDPVSSKDLRVIFVNVQVMANEAAETLPGGLQFINMMEGDEALNAHGWQELYTIAGTHLFLITPDHLVRPLHGTTADELYKEVSFFNTKIRPTATPDVRLLDATVSNGNKAQIRIQNFSTTPVQNIQVVVMKDGQSVAQATYNVSVVALEDAVIPITLPEGSEAGLTIIAKADGDTNPMNNRWTGALRNVSDAAMFAGTFGK